MVRQRRRRARRGSVVLIAGLCAGIVSTGCARSPVAASQQQLTVSIQGDPATLNPVQSSTATEFDVLNNTMEGLVRIGSDGVPQGGIASGWKVSSDGLTYTFTLRNAHWSNGDAVTAQDFVYGWLRTLDPDTGAQYAYMIGMVVKGANDYNSFAPDKNKSDADNKAAKDALRAAVGAGENPVSQGARHEGDAFVAGGGSCQGYHAGSPSQSGQEAPTIPGVDGSVRAAVRRSREEGSVRREEGGEGDRLSREAVEQIAGGLPAPTPISRAEYPGVGGREGQVIRRKVRR